MLAQGRGRWAVSQIPKLIPIFSAFFTRPPPHSFLVWPVFSFDPVLSLSLRNTSEIHSKNPPATHAKPVPSWPSWICICTEPACRIIIDSTFPLLLEQFKGDVEVGLSIPHFHVYWLNCMLQDGSLPPSCCLGFQLSRFPAWRWGGLHDEPKERLLGRQGSWWQKRICSLFCCCFKSNLSNVV